MKSLSTLIKLQKTYVDEQRQLMARLQDALAIVENQIAELEIQKAREQIAAQENEEARSTFGVFIKSALEKGKDLERQRVVVLNAVEEARNRLMELFEEQKRYETAEAARIAAEEREERRRETQELDEVGSVQFTRKKE